jgi:hypothetical protein
MLNGVIQIHLVLGVPNADIVVISPLLEVQAKVRSNTERAYKLALSSVVEVTELMEDDIKSQFPNAKSID